MAPLVCFLQDFLKLGLLADLLAVEISAVQAELGEDLAVALHRIPTHVVAVRDRSHGERCDAEHLAVGQQPSPHTARCDGEVRRFANLGEQPLSLCGRQM